MIIHLTSGDEVSLALNPSNMTAYKANSITLYAEDVRRLRSLVEHSPQEALMALYQWENRFPENRP